MTPLEEYRDLETQLRLLRIKNDFRESLEEDALLDRMDDIWYKQLTPEELKLLYESYGDGNLS